MGNYIPVTENEKKEMLLAIGIDSIDALFGQIPEEMIIKGGLDLPEGLSETLIHKKMTAMAEKNRVFKSLFRGAGAYQHYIPAIVKSITGKEAFLTAYTPYQAEVSQGILQTIFEYQTMMCELTGLDDSNASVYDGATAAAEAIAMCKARKKNKALVSATANPGVIETIKTYCHGNGMEVVVIPEKNGETNIELLKRQLDDGVACLYLQQPNYFGIIEAAEEISQLIHTVNGKLIMGVNPIAMAVLKTPAECQADIAVGEGQPLGMPLGFGGPYLGFMTCKAEMTRKLPGRIVGETTDLEGKQAFVLTLQAREQHIRREKAASNICSNQALCAMTAAVYLTAVGPRGLKEAAIQSMSKAAYLKEQLAEIGYAAVFDKPFFNEFVTEAKGEPEKIMASLADNGILGGLPLTGEHMGHILWCCTEMNSKDEIDTLIQILKEV
ncbi:aminomethyl-transferring glycine dehydrogenase subunit GcvPA [Acetobacterium sp.]|uniref:aminomethyl-transferring glycine dehydrogenase subunit GcvPA n=1 Tax=Acetobacterium sp. TaxID=1872094 RepID=UPI0035935753